MENVINFGNMQAIIINPEHLTAIRKAEAEAKKREQAAIKQLEAQNGKKYGT